MKRTIRLLTVLFYFLIMELTGQDKSIDKKVDILLAELGNRESRQKAIIKFNALGSKAAPRILFHVSNKTKVWSLMSIDACRYIWTEDTKNTCLKVTQYKNEKMATLAMAALIKNIPFKALCKMCDPILHKMHPSCGNIIFIFLQSKTPSKERLLRLANNKGYWSSVALYLCNYRGQKINRVTRILLVKGTKEVKLQALNGLIFQADTAAKVKKYILKLLTSKYAELRERAAEYMRWYGLTEDLKILAKSAVNEKDLYTRASIKAAMSAIKTRKKIFSSTENVIGDAQKIHHNQKGFYAQAITCLTKLKTTSQRDSVIQSIYKMNSEEPHYVYGSAKQIDQRLTKNQYRVFRLLAGYPSLEVFDNVPEETPFPAPEKFFTVPPIPNYFDSKRKSFGKLIAPNSGPFSESHHVGDDCAWFQQLTPVVSVADGIVRHVSHIISWGGIVIIEHKKKNGDLFCSLYAHLGPLIIVKPGDTVKVGDKIATLGRSNSWENGGYKAHLHFGIYNSEFNNRWICGYISKKLYASRDHKWLNPQVFIKKHLK